MKKPWSITTTLRNPERLRSFLIVLKTLEGQQWNSEIQIPAVCSTLNGKSKLISVSYQLNFNFFSNDDKINLTIPIIIGNIPYKLNDTRLYPKNKDTLYDILEITMKSDN